MEKGPMKKIAAIAGVVMILGVVLFVTLRGKEETARYRTEKVSRGDIVATVTASGTVNAVTTVQVGTQVSGTIKAIYADFNSPVRQGQLIAQIDPALFEAQVGQARANLLSAKAGLVKSEASAADARRTMERNSRLFSRDLIARSDLDTAETNFDTSAAQVEVSKAQVQQAAAALRTAETNLRYTRILSPVNGRVVSRNVDVGQTVAASFQTPTLFTIAQDLTKMQIDTNVDEADIGRVREGQEVEFSVDAYPDMTFKGKVSQVRNAPISVQNVVTYDVVIKVDNPVVENGHSPLLKPGMTADVKVLTRLITDALLVPKEAVKTKDGGTGVFVVENGFPRWTPVKTAETNGVHTVISEGIGDGAEVVTSAINPN